MIKRFFLKPDSDRLNIVFIVFLAVYVVLSAYALTHFLKVTLLGDAYYRSAYGKMVEGKAWKPFVYRALVPGVTRAINLATPASVKESVTEGISGMLKNSRIAKRLGWPKKLFPENANNYARMVTILILYGCLWGYVIFMYKMGTALFPGTTAIRYFAPAFALLAISSFSTRPWTQYIYDIPVLFLASGCYYFMLFKRFRWYIAFFTLACLNKETTIFILIFFAIWFYKKLDRETYFGLLAMQVMLYAIIKLALTMIFKHNPGPFLDYSLYMMIQGELLATANYPRILGVAMIFLLLTYRWQQKTDFLKTVFWIFPLMYVAFIIYGRPGEYRVFFDILPLIVLLATHTLMDASGLSRIAMFHSQAQEDYVPGHPAP